MGYPRDGGGVKLRNHLPYKIYKVVTIQTMKSQVVIGLGEVGQAIRSILSCDGIDKEGGEGEYDVLHICFPYFEGFEEQVRKYKESFGADLAVIHSTVPIGTSLKLGAVHSPIRGVHPHLEEGIRTFVKYFGGERAHEAAELFPCLTTKCVSDSRTTEAAKLWDTEQYREFILLNKKIHTWCEEHNVDFDIVYTDFNQTYNEGYTRLGRPEVVRPYLKYMEGPIGGHCVEPNHKILSAAQADG